LEEKHIAKNINREIGFRAKLPYEKVRPETARENLIVIKEQRRL
jgi:hypothetical protein